MDDTLGNAFGVETAKLFKGVDVLKENRSVFGYGLTVLIGPDTMTGLTGEIGRGIALNDEEDGKKKKKKELGKP